MAAGLKCRHKFWVRCHVQRQSALEVHSTDASKTLAAAGWRDQTSTVSTAQLKALLPVHMRPINLVVYQGSFVFRQASLILWGASCLDAFSSYPCRT
jgi:hypothetical protein